MDFHGTGARLTPRDFAEAAAMIRVPVATIRGVVEVEAAGKGFDADNRPKILTEGHIFYRQLGRGLKRDRAVKEGLAWPGWGDKPYPKTSDACYERLARMMAIDATAALKSCSWGLAQIIGLNHKDVGYPTVQKIRLIPSGGGRLLIMRLAPGHSCTNGSAFRGERHT
jgi:hypothetical protein